MNRPGQKVGYHNRRAVSMDEDSWNKFIELQKLTGKTKAQLLREMLNKELRIVKQEVPEIT